MSSAYLYRYSRKQEKKKIEILRWTLLNNFRILTIIILKKETFSFLILWENSQKIITESYHVTYLMYCWFSWDLHGLSFFLFSIIKMQFISTATVFLEFWKRRRAVLTYDWDLIDWEDEEVRQSRSKSVDLAVTTI